MYYILTPFTWLLTLFYNLFNSYGIALLLFAVVIKVILFPLSLKGKRGMIQMNMLQGQQAKLQKMYGNNKERYNEELQKLYEKEKVNPMSGCLWSFLPLLILLPLYAIIRQPLMYMMGVVGDNAGAMLQAIANAVNWNSVAVSNGWIKEAADAFANTGYNQLYLASLITPENLGTVRDAVLAVGTPAKDLIAINFDFLGLIDLSQIPKLKFWTVPGGFGLFLLPVISAASGVVFSFLSMKTNAINQQAAQASNPSSKMMMIISPLISLWIGFAMPAALCLYWIANNLLSMVQELLCARLLKKDYEKAAAAQAQRELEEKEAEKRRKEDARQERARRMEEAKQSKGKKKAAPKKKDDENVPASVKEASRVGIRTYARGRAYDPYRFSEDGPTPYGADALAVDDAAVEKVLEEQAEAREKAEFAAKYQLTEEEMREVEAEAEALAEETAGTETADEEALPEQAEAESQTGPEEDTSGDEPEEI